MSELQKFMPDEGVIVIGGGASGMMAAGRAAEMGAHVTLLERTGTLGKKILISGKTRCNLTNARDLDHFISMYGPNGRFLYGAFHRFFRDDLISFLGRYGVGTKIERGGRVFPVSDSAEDVVSAFKKYLTDHRVEILRHSRVTGIETRNKQVTGVVMPDGKRQATALILAAGGSTYPATGSSGDGYAMAATLGHTINKLRPALVPLVVEEISRAKSMQGVSLRNVRLTAFQCRADKIDPSLVPNIDIGRGTGNRRPHPPIIESRMGEMMITHFGIGGPTTLLMSLSIIDALERGPVSVSIDLKPALDRMQLSRRLQRDFDRFSKKKYRSIVRGLVPAKMVDPLILMTGITADKCGCEISAAERERLTDHLKSLRFNIKDSLPMSSAIVTAGGVSLKEIDPRTMASRKIRGLYLCGEVIDIDADTGGYNLQAAFSTGYLAGENAAAYVNSKGPSMNCNMDC
ncbi:MAG TPA: NAD(P)/FAD-dependent oxidoreductase [Syntrophales bacterium]|nr:NAD(P)/FAD-dependent oxidoreductase [Syntrophales bacterium]